MTATETLLTVVLVLYGVAVVVLAVTVHRLRSHVRLLFMRRPKRRRRRSQGLPQ